MKKWLIIIFMLYLGGVGVSQNGATAVSAQEITPVPLQTDQVVTLEQLGISSDIVLSGPQASSRQVFGLPATWQLTSEAELRLNFALFGVDDPPPASTLSQEVTVDIELNNVVLERIKVQETGDQNVTISIPDQALIPTREDGRHRLDFTIHSQESCLADRHPAVVIRPNSQLFLPHESRLPSADLTKFPYPLFEQSFLPESAAIIVPDEPSISELEAAMHIAVGLGTLTNNAFQLSLLPENSLTADIQTSQHIILVGKPGQFNVLEAVTLPAALQDNQFNLVEMKANDGVIQMAQSPWNTEKLVLLVSGHSDAGVAKAGQALSAGHIQASSQKDIALVADVQVENFYRRVVTTDQSLAQLGYESQTITDPNNSAIEYIFQIPAGQVASTDAQLDLNIAHSSLLNYQTSGVNISVNGQPVDSFTLSGETAETHIESVIIPQHILQPGSNRIRVLAELIPLSACSRLENQGIWFTIYNNSLLHIPLTMQAPLSADNLFLNQYPRFLNLSSTLSELAFVLPQNSPSAWQIAAEIAFAMGRTGNILLSDLAVAFSDLVPDEVRQNRHLLLVGQPIMLPLLVELNDMLPVPFDAGTNRLAEDRFSLVYRLPNNISSGYLELLPAPWHENRVVLALLGNTDLGVRQAATALADNDMRAQLAGDFALVGDSGQLLVSDSRARLRQTLQTQNSDPTQAPLATPIVSETATTQPVLADSRPGWLLPGLIISGILMILVIVYVAASSWRQQHVS